MALVCFFCLISTLSACQLVLPIKFAARFSNCCNSLNFEAKINFNTTRQNELKWRKRCTGLKFDLEYFDGPQTKFIGDSLQKHPVYQLIFITLIFETFPPSRMLLMKQPSSPTVGKVIENLVNVDMAIKYIFCCLTIFIIIFI